MTDALTPEHGTGVARGLVRVDGRSVSYVRGGDGPPVVLLHTGMSSARWMLPLLERLAGDQTVVALDHPGYGDSDRLPGRHVTIRRLSEALGTTLDALRLPGCPIFGSHTGAAMALELGRRRPSRASALILEGTCLFSPREIVFFSSPAYLPRFEVDGEGSHLFATWVKLRDTVTWFPWSRRTARNRRPFPAIPTTVLHESFVDLLRAGDGYRDAYRAAFEHDGHAAAAALTLPATFAAHRGDVLYAHLDRLPPLRPNQRIVRGPADMLGWHEELPDIVRSYRVRRHAPPAPPFRPTPGAVNRRYVDVAGGQILVRSCGERRLGRPPLLLLHDGRASSRVFEPLMRELAGRRAVVAPDLPGNGASDRFTKRRPSIADYADVVARTVAALQLDPCDIYAVGASAGVALELACRSGGAARVVLEAPDFYPKRFALRLAAEWAPPLEPAWDGSHLTRLWLMLRDEYAFWPWFDRTNPVAVDAPRDWHEFHARVADVARSLRTYQLLTEAALRYDWRAALQRTTPCRPRVAATAQEPRRLHAEAAVRVSGLDAVIELPSAPRAKAAALLSLFES